MNFYFCGFQKSGKSYFGKMVSTILKRPFFDLDGCLTQKFDSIDIRELWMALGRSRFRQEEEKIFQKLTKEQRDAIISLGGGTLETKCNVESAAKTGKLIYLYLPKEEVKNRLWDTPQMPPYFSDYGSFDEFFEMRHTIFLQAADRIINIKDSEKTIKEIVDYALK
jgi:shikimate kinase